MVRQCIELLQLGYKNCLNMSFTLDDVTIGESCGPDKVSFHIMVYDGKYAWDTGLSKIPPFNSSQRTFIEWLKAETLLNPDK